MTKKNLTNESKPQGHVLPTIPSRDEWHRTYGGRINYSDLTGYPAHLVDIARHIATDFKFDNMCANNIAARNRLMEKEIENNG